MRLRPKNRADIWDTVLDGIVAVIEGFERDFEDRVHLSVTIADDPAASLASTGISEEYRPQVTERFYRATDLEDVVMYRLPPCLLKVAQSFQGHLQGAAQHEVHLHP